MSKDELLSTKIALLEQNHRNLMDKIEEILTRFDKFEEKLDCALAKKADKYIVDRLQDNVQWISYLIIGTVITGIIGFVFFK